MARPGLSILRASGAASVYVWGRGEEEVAVLCRLSSSRGGVAAGVGGAR